MMKCDQNPTRTRRPTIYPFSHHQRHSIAIKDDRPDLQPKVSHHSSEALTVNSLNMSFNCLKIPRHKPNPPDGDIPPPKCKPTPTSRASITMPRKLSDPANRLFQREKSLSKHRIQSRFPFEACHEEATGSTFEQLAYEVGFEGGRKCKSRGC